MAATLIEISGPRGCGKTHLGDCIAETLRTTRFRTFARFYDSPEGDDVASIAAAGEFAVIIREVLAPDRRLRIDGPDGRQVRLLLASTCAACGWGSQVDH